LTPDLAVHQDECFAGTAASAPIKSFVFQVSISIKLFFLCRWRRNKVS